MKISSILVAFLENMNFTKSTIVYPIEPKKESSTDAIPLVMRVLKLVKKNQWHDICKSLMDLIYSSNVNFPLISHKLYTQTIALVHIRSSAY